MRRLKFLLKYNQTHEYSNQSHESTLRLVNLPAIGNLLFERRKKIEDKNNLISKHEKRN